MKRPRGKRKNWQLLRARRLKQVTTLLKDRCPRGLPPDDAGREYLFELLLVMSAMPHADIKMPYAIRAWAPWMPPDEAAELVDRINRIPIWDRWRSGQDLGKRLRLTNAERERMRLYLIWPHNMSKADLLRQRKQKARERKRRRRRSAGAKPRAKWLAKNNISRTKQWELAGFDCRRTWERHGKPAANGNGKNHPAGNAKPERFNPESKRHH
jgi:hypothetical protein